MMSTMCSIWGHVSVPAGSFGFGSESGLRRIGTVVVVDTPGRGAVDFVDDEQPARSPIAAAAPSAASPFRSERRETAPSNSTVRVLARYLLQWAPCPGA